MKPNSTAGDKNKMIRDLFNNFTKIGKGQKNEDKIVENFHLSENQAFTSNLANNSNGDTTDENKLERSEDFYADEQKSEASETASETNHNDTPNDTPIEKASQQDIKTNDYNTYSFNTEPVPPSYEEPEHKKDKLSIDLLSAAEQVIKDRHMLKLAITDLESKLANEKDSSARLKNEKVILERFIDEKENEISQLEHKLTNKQIKFDELIDDYKELQSKTSNEINELKYSLDKEYTRYNNLSKDYTQYKAESANQLEELEEKVRELKAENEKLQSKYNNIVEEKANLMKTINDFTSHMSSSFNSSQK